MKKQKIKSNSPCGKPEREKEFELHAVSEIMLDVVLIFKVTDPESALW